jgi:ATP-dependent Clp protease ATP-binding subunit ClpC
MKEYPNLSPASRRTLLSAKTIAKDCRHEFLTTEHILLALLNRKTDTIGIKVMSREGMDLEAFRAFIISNLSKWKGKTQPDIDQIEPSSRLLSMMSYASCVAQELGSELIQVDHLLLSILVSDTGTGNNLFRLKNIDTSDLYESIYIELEPTRKARNKSKTKQPITAGGGREPADGSPEMSSLTDYAVNLTEEAANKQLDPVIGRDEELQDVIQILSRRTKNNPVLIGDPGVGKTAVVELLAQRIVIGDVPYGLKEKQIYALDLARLVAGTIYRGQFEERLKNAISFVTSRPDIILFIDELHMLVGAGATTGSMDASNILKPALARGKISCIGATTTMEYKEHIEGDGALERRFQAVIIDQPSSEDTIEILRGIKHKYEMYHNVKYGQAVLNTIVMLCDRYMPEKSFPDKAIDVLDEVGAKARISQYSKKADVLDTVKELDIVIQKKEAAVLTQKFTEGIRHRTREMELRDKLIEQDQAYVEDQEKEFKTVRITLDCVNQLVSDRTGVPVTKLQEGEASTLHTLSKRISNRVVGQSGGIGKIVNSIKRSRAGISNPDKPICSLLFLGPTGVGKTHLARCMGEEMFSSNSFKQFDMSEFTEKHSISKFIGAPPGYVGYGEGGALTEFVRFNPYCVLLFDEIEKAHPEVMQIFLQLLEYGILTDSEGLEVNFKNTIIVMTSNIGSHKFEKGTSVGFGSAELSIEQAVHEEIEKLYPPEFLNRIDETVVFNKLTDRELNIICNILLKELKSNIRKNTKRRVNIAGEVSPYIVDQIVNNKYGARPLKRCITKCIETPLADHIIATVNSSSPINIEVTDNNITIS